MNDDDLLEVAADTPRPSMTALLLLAVVVLVLLNGFFVAAEFALVRSRKAHLQTDAGDEGKRGAATARGDDGRPRALPVGGQFGITLTSLGLGFLGEPAIGVADRAAIRRGGPALASRRRSRSRSPT